MAFSLFWIILSIINNFSTSILFSSNLQTALPANGAPVLRQRTGRVRELYNEYVRYRTLENWKFWIVSIFYSFIFRHIIDIIFSLA